MAAASAICRYTALRDEAVQRMITACADPLETAGAEKIRPVVAADHTGSSRFVDFHTTRTTLMRTDPAKSQVNFVLWESTWEAAFAERMERLDRVQRLREEQRPRFRGAVHVHGRGARLPAGLYCAGGGWQRRSAPCGRGDQGLSRPRRRGQARCADAAVAAGRQQRWPLGPLAGDGDHRADGDGAAVQREGVGGGRARARRR